VQVAIDFAENPDAAVPHSDLGWELYPEGFTRSLTEAAAYGLPILITENGIADADDSLRPAFIVSHLEAMQAARVAGVSVEGYLHWSLIDNLEWVEGFGPRFGLLRVDYRDPERPRTRTRGAQALSEIIRAGGVTEAIAAKYGRL